MSTQEEIIAFVNLINNTKLYLIIGAFVIVCMLLLLLINKKSSIVFLWYAVSFGMVGAILYSLPSATDFLISMLEEDVPSITSNIAVNFLTKFKDFGLIFIIISALFILILIVLKIIKNKKSKQEKKIDMLSELNDK